MAIRRPKSCRPITPRQSLAVLHYRTLASADVGLVAGDTIGDRADASDSHPSGLARPSRLGRLPIRSENPVRSAVRRRASACNRIARPDAGIRASEEQAADCSRCATPEFWPNIRLRFRNACVSICESESGSIAKPQAVARLCRGLPWSSPTISSGLLTDTGSPTTLGGACRK